MKPIFITGISTGVGKTLVAAIVTEALQADYWKPVQAGFADGTDALEVEKLISNSKTVIHPETYKLVMPASPHIAAQNENVIIDLEKIAQHFSTLNIQNDYLVIEGAGGLMVPLSEEEFIFDLIKKLNAQVLLVSRNYLGSINHSLLTAAVCRQQNLQVLGWMFNDQYLNYEADIVRWSGYPAIGNIPLLVAPDKQQILPLAQQIKQQLLQELAL